MIEQQIGPTAAQHDGSASVIDLRGAADEQEILRRIGAVLKGASYQHDVSQPNMDMLQELVEDWFAEHWGEQHTIVVQGAKEQLGNQSTAMLEVVLMLGRAEMWTMERKLRSDPKADSITPYLNLRICLS